LTPLLTQCVDEARDGHQFVVATGELRVGCSGWSYKDWRGSVYPAELPQRCWFECYQQLFDTVELNSTFYRLPSAVAVEAWAAAAKPGFVFALKLGDAATWLPNHLDRAQRLGAHLGPTLVQLPPRWKRNAARLDEFLEVAPKTMRWAVELRDPSWLHDDVFEVLRKHRTALCVHDLLPSHPFELTTAWTYVRFHGPDAINRPYYGAYEAAGLQPWADRLRFVLDSGRDVYAYFNNDWHGNAVRDAAILRDQLVP